MEWEVVFQSVVLPALIAALVGIVMHKRQKSVDFDYDYRRYILAKRQSAYERLESVMTHLSSKLIGKDGKPFMSIFYYTGDSENNPLHVFNLELNAQCSDSFWFSDNILEHLMSLNRRINDWMNDWRSNPTSEVLISLGKKHYKELEQRRRDLYSAYLEDLQHLHKIDDFKKAKTVY